MSYILEALKKADQERKQGELPDLKSISPASTGAGEKSRSTIWLIAAIAIAAAILWFRPWQQPQQIVQPSQPLTFKQTEKPLEEAPQATTLQSEATRVIEPKQVHEERDNPVDKTSEALPEKRQPVTEAKNGATAESGGELTRNLPTIMELPAHIRNALPTISISGHIYDESPAGRMIIINDRVLREGRSIDDKLSIHEITGNGVILDYAGTLFFMSPFDAWPQ